MGSVMIGRTNYKGIGDNTIPDYHKTPFKEAFDNGIDWYRVRRQQDLGDPELSPKAKVEFRAKQVTFGSFRGAMLLFIKNNGGGIATSMYNAAFRVIPTKLPIPNEAFTALAELIKNYAKEIGYKIPTASQEAQIKSLINLKVVSVKPLKVTRDREPKDVYNQILGPGQYDLFLKYAAYSKSETDKLNNSYTIPAATPENIKKFNNVLLLKWFNLGGNPEALIGAVIEGNQKSPRGRDANYMMMIVKTRGIQPKDIGLIIRGFASAFVGDRFEWGSKSTYIFGTKRIGLTGAEVATWVGANLPLVISLFGILREIIVSIKGVGESKAIKREIDSLLAQGYIYESDYLDLNTPRPKVMEVKRFEVPTAEVDSAGLLDVALTLATNSTKAKDLEKQAAGDKNTQDFLNKAVAMGTKVDVKSGFSSVALVKVDPKTLVGGEDETDMSKLLLPAVGAIAAYLLLFNKEK